MVLIYSLYMYSRTKQIFQHVALFYSSIFFLGSVGNIIFPNIEPWAVGLFLIATGLIWGLYTFNKILGPSWLGYLLPVILGHALFNGVVLAVVLIAGPDVLGG